jgi:hypothetical protein
MVKQAESVVALRERVLRQLEQDENEANTVETTATTVELNGFLNGGQWEVALVERVLRPTRTGRRGEYRRDDRNSRGT